MTSVINHLKKSKVEGDLKLILKERNTLLYHIQISSH